MLSPQLVIHSWSPSCVHHPSFHVWASKERARHFLVPVSLAVKGKKTTSSRLKNISIKAASHILWHLGHPGCFHWICSSLLKFHRHLLLNTFRTATPEFSFSLPLPLQIHDFGQSSLHSPTASVKVEGLNNASHLER